MATESPVLRRTSEDHVVVRGLKAFDNGEPYYPLDGREIWVPASTEARPSREFLEWHADSVFRE